MTLGTAGAVAYAAHVRDERIEDVAKLCVGNGLRFLGCIATNISSRLGIVGVVALSWIPDCSRFQCRDVSVEHVFNHLR